jgi:hypothetical protein
VSDFTPRDALAEVLDGDQGEYRKAAEEKAADYRERYEIAHESFMVSQREVDRLRGILDGFDAAMRAPRERRGRALNEVWTAWLDDTLYRPEVTP